MDTARRNEIAYGLLKLRFKQEGVTVDHNFRRQVGSDAKDTGIPFGEMLEFQKGLANVILDEVTEVTKPATADELKGHHGHHHGRHGGH